MKQAGQFERDYWDALDGLRFSGEGKGRIMKNLMEQREAKPAKRRGIRPLRAGLIAACLCLALAGTAFAASPTLRSLLAEALGGFEPYAQEQDDTVYTTEDGFEFKVLSAMSDNFTTRAYVQVKDLKGEDRLDRNKDPHPEYPNINIHIPLDLPIGGKGSSGECSFKNYDAQTQTAVAVVTEWATPSSGSHSPAELEVSGLFESDLTPVTVPLDVEIIPGRTLAAFKNGTLDGLQIDGLQVLEIQMSPLGINVTTELGEAYAGKLTAVKDTFRVCLKDGTQVDTGCAVGHGTYRNNLNQTAYEVLIWNFDEPMDLEQVSGIYMDDLYFPVAW